MKTAGDDRTRPGGLRNALAAVRVAALVGAATLLAGSSRAEERN